MLSVNSIKNGIVIDHIKAGLAIEIFNYLGLDKADYSVALIMNVDSKKLGKKDIIKIENQLDIDYAVLGFIDPNITIDIVENENIVKKTKLKLPNILTDIISCKNPRCVTSVETHVPHVFYLVNEATAEYRCQYCDNAYDHKK